MPETPGMGDLLLLLATATPALAEPMAVCGVASALPAWTEDRSTGFCARMLFGSSQTKGGARGLSAKRFPTGLKIFLSRNSV